MGDHDLGGMPKPKETHYLCGKNRVSRGGKMVLTRGDTRQDLLNKIHTGIILSQRVFGRKKGLACADHAKNKGTQKNLTKTSGKTITPSSRGEFIRQFFEMVGRLNVV